MNLTDVVYNVGNTPFISKSHGSFIYNLIINEKLTNILELGIAHGTATCYMAAAIEELGQGKVTSVDLQATKNTFTPSIETQLEQTKLSHLVSINRMKTGYTWFLHDDIVKNTNNNQCEPIYDLCIIDGPKNWTIDGAAFFLADKLLKDKGWIVFDDYNWKYADANSTRTSTDGITHRTLSTNEINTAQIKDVFELLVKQHPHYGNFMVFNNEWAIAQKIVPSNQAEDNNLHSQSKSSEITSLYKQSEHYHITFAIEQLEKESIKQVVVYGAGSELSILLDELNTKGIDVVAIVDRDESKFGTKIQGVPITSLAKTMKGSCHHYLLNSITYQDEMRKAIFEAYENADELLKVIPYYRN